MNSESDSYDEEDYSCSSSDTEIDVEMEVDNDDSGEWVNESYESEAMVVNDNHGGNVPDVFPREGVISTTVHSVKVVGMHFTDVLSHTDQIDRVVRFEVDNLTEALPTIICPLPKHNTNKEDQEWINSYIAETLEPHLDSIYLNNNQKEALAAVTSSLGCINNILPGSGGGRGGGGSGDNDPSGPDKNNNDDDSEMDFMKIGGLESQIKYLKRAIIHPLKSQRNSPEFPPPKGVLFFGPPGTGKTITARAMATELQKELKQTVKFYYRKGPDCFNMYVGETQKILTRLFAEAVRFKPSIIFFDEIDGLCPSRDRVHNSAEIYNTIVTTLLGLMDTLVPGEVVVIGATNRVESLDPAMIRPGRFDKNLVFNPPDEQGRLNILKINLRNWDISERPPDAFLKAVAEKTSGYTGADLEKLCRDAFMCAFDRHLPDINANSTTDGLTVTGEDWETALMAMKHTDLNSFGSFLYIPKKPPSIAAPLLENQTGEVMRMLRQLAPLKPSNKGVLENNSLTFHSFYIYDKTWGSSPPVDNIFISHILSGTAFSHCTTYLISLETISTKHNHLKAISQAENSSSPCVLLITGLDEICSRYPDVSTQIAKELNHLLRGKEILLLASGSCQASYLAVPEFRELFTGYNRSYEIKFSKEDERAKFFCMLYRVGLDKDPKLNLNKLRQLTMLVTAGSGIAALISLHEDLRRTINEFSGKGKLYEHMTEILLRHSPQK